MIVLFTVIFIVITLGTIVAMILALVKPELLAKEKSDSNQSSSPQKSKVSKSSAFGDTKDFYPVKEFFDHAFSLGGYNYRAIIECSSINYDLRSPHEQKIVDMSFQRFLNSLDFPIEIYGQTTRIDVESIMKSLHEDIQESMEMFPMINRYAKKYEECMEQITSYIGNEKIKRKYVIVTVCDDDLKDLTALEGDEYHEYAIEELNTRINIVANGLVGAGIDVNVLDKKGIANVLYSYYHRRYYQFVADIMEGVYSTISVGKKQKYEPECSVDVILNEAQERIKAEISGNSSAAEIQFYQKMVDELDALKIQSKSMSIKEMLDLSRERAEFERKASYGLKQVDEPDEALYKEAKELEEMALANDEMEEYSGTQLFFGDDEDEM